MLMTAIKRTHCNTRILVRIEERRSEMELTWAIAGIPVDDDWWLHAGAPRLQYSEATEVVTFDTIEERNRLRKTYEPQLRQPTGL